MKTRFLSGFLAVVGGGIAIVGCFEPTNKVSAESPRVVTAPLTPATTPVVDQQPVAVQATPAPVTSQATAVQPAQTNVAAVSAVPENLSPGITEIAKLFQSNVSENVLVAYVNNYSGPLDASADEILYLNDLGVSDNVVTAILNHKSTAAVTAPQPAPAPAAPAPAPAAPPAPAPEANAQAVTAPLVPQGTSAPEQPVTVNYFYENLSPYGTWVETEYGRCWRPAVVVTQPGWRPYCDRGHWVYTDAGWYWASDYSWGWATFHYGRWCTDVRYGWVWVPDVVWGPSWVSWRYSSDYCGWAPLPPAAHFHSGVGFTYHGSGVSVSFDFGLTDSCYTFVPSHRFCDPHPYRYVAPRNQTTIIYKNTTVVNNYIVNNHSKTIVNEGVGRQRIEIATKKPVQRVAIHEVPSNSAPVGSPDRIHKVGNDLVIYKPKTPEVVKPRVVVKPTPFANRNASAPNTLPGYATPGAGAREAQTPNAIVTRRDNVISKPNVSAGRATVVEAPNRPAHPAVGEAPDRPKHPPVSEAPNRPTHPTVSEAPNRPVGIKPLAEAKPTSEWPPAAAAPKTAPLVPKANNENIYRDNSRFESPRSNGQPTPPSKPAPAAPATPAYKPASPSHEGYGSPRQNPGYGSAHRQSEYTPRQNPNSYQRGEGAGQQGRGNDRDQSDRGNGRGRF